MFILLFYSFLFFNCLDGMWKFDLTETPRKGIGYIVPGLLDNVPSQVSTVLERVRVSFPSILIYSIAFYC